MSADLQRIQSELWIRKSTIAYIDENTEDDMLEVYLQGVTDPVLIECDNSDEYEKILQTLVSK